MEEVASTNSRERGSRRIAVELDTDAGELEHL